MSEIKITTAVGLPEKAARRGPAETYPFDALPAPVQVKDKDGKPALNEAGEPIFEFASFPTQRTAKQMASTCYSAMRRYAKEKKDKNGKPVLNEKNNPVFIREREFKCYNVDPTTDPDGAISRVWRIK